MARFHNLLLVALIILRFSHKALRSDRGAENYTGPKLPDLTVFFWSSLQCEKELEQINARRPCSDVQYLMVHICINTIV